VLPVRYELNLYMLTSVAVYRLTFNNCSLLNDIIACLPVVVLQRVFQYSAGLPGQCRIQRTGIAELGCCQFEAAQRWARRYVMKP
jgi:hypothetical protein